MNKNYNSRSGFIHLYNPKNEGLGRYDIHYINAYRKIKKSDDYLIKKEIRSYAAWFHI